MKTLSIKFIICTVIILFNCSNKLHGQCHERDFFALKALYESTEGENWTNTDGWELVRDNASPPGGCDLSTMWGIELHPTSGRVRTVELRINNVGGSLPDEIGELDSLEYIRIDQSPISGPIPASIGDLEKLNFIYFNSSDFSGSLPASLGNLDNLTTIFLASTNLSGTIPPELFGAEKLSSLWLQGNDFTGSIPIEIGNATSLRNVRLAGNQLDGQIPQQIGHLIELTEFSAENNNLSGSIPEELGLCSKLEKIVLSSNDLSGPIPHSLFFLEELERLSLGSNQLSGSLPDSIAFNLNMRELSLHSNHLTGSLPSHMNNYPFLQRLNLSNNQLSGVVHPGIAGLSSLIDLNLGQNNLTGQLPPFWHSMVSLTTLDLADNNLTGSIPDSLGALPIVTRIYLQNNNLSGEIPESILELNQLFNLDLSRNNLSGSIPDSISRMTNLFELRLNSNKLSGEIPESLGELEILRTLTLNENQLSGCIPGALGKISTLDWLGLDNNKLEGIIPPELGDLTNLTYLNIRDNLLSGCFHPNLASLCSIADISRIGFSFDASWTDFCSDPNNAPGNCFSCISGNSEFNHPETKALENLYNNTDGDNWTNNDNWMNCDPCGYLGGDPWFGVTCDSTKLKILSVRLGNNNLNGNLDSSIGGLKHASVIDLKQNTITGAIPAGVNGLINIDTLDLSSNIMQGEYPKELGDLTHASYINLDNTIRNTISCFHPNLLHVCSAINTDQANWLGFCNSQKNVCTDCNVIDYFWTGGVSTAWENGANWDTGCVPNKEKIVHIAANDLAEITSPNMTAKMVHIDLGGALSILESNDLTLLNADSAIINKGQFYVNGGLDIFLIDSIGIYNEGTMIFDSEGSVSIDGGKIGMYNKGMFYNDADVLISDQESIGCLQSGDVFENKLQGNITYSNTEVSSSTGIKILSFLTNEGVIDIRKAGTYGVHLSDQDTSAITGGLSPWIDNSGDIRIDSSGVIDLYLSNKVTFYGNFGQVTITNAPSLGLGVFGNSTFNMKKAASLIIQNSLGIPFSVGSGSILNVIGEVDLE